jgi:hypothetical protein
VGWYVYAGESDADLRRQNVLPLSPEAPWLEPTIGLRLDLPRVPAQSPEWYVRNDRRLRRS